jgi:hypothetical protein
VITVPGDCLLRREARAEQSGIGQQAIEQLHARQVIQRAGRLTGSDAGRPAT